MNAGTRRWQGGAGIRGAEDPYGTRRFLARLMVERKLLVVTALAETGVGLTLLLSPPLVAGLLLGVSIDAPAVLVVGRMPALRSTRWAAPDSWRAIGPSRARRGWSQRCCCITALLRGSRKRWREPRTLTRGAEVGLFHSSRNEFLTAERLDRRGMARPMHSRLDARSGQGRGDGHLWLRPRDDSAVRDITIDADSAR